MQDQDFKLYSRTIFLHQNEKKMREWSFKTIICLNPLAKHTWGNDQYKGAILCLEGKILENEMVISFNQTRRHLGLQKTA
jgi:hypothetical protein